MAACGTAEHNEARRKEMVYLRKAYHQKKYQEMTREYHHQEIMNQSTDNRPLRRPTTYDMQLNNMRKRGMVDNETYLRYMQHEKPRNDFVARTVPRYSNNDYLSQW